MDKATIIVCIIIFLPLPFFGIRNLIIHNKLKNKKLTGKTNAYLNSYEYQKDVLARHRVIPNLTSLAYAYTVNDKKYKLKYYIETKPNSKNLQRTIQVLYLKSNPKYAFCELTRFNYAIFGWITLLAGIVLIATISIAFISSL